MTRQVQRKWGKIPPASFIFLAYYYYYFFKIRRWGSCYRSDVAFALNVTSLISLEWMVGPKGSDPPYCASRTECPSHFLTVKVVLLLTVKVVLLGDGFQWPWPDLFKQNGLIQGMDAFTVTHRCQIINSHMDWTWKSLKIKTSLIQNIPTWQGMLSPMAHLGWQDVCLCC